MKNKKNVFLFVPNLIGYARVILAILSWVKIDEARVFLPLYLISCLLDAVDGHAARALNQSSRFGAVLDMITDRSTTAGLVCYLASRLSPGWMVPCQLLLALDLSSHYMHMYASLASGASSHKTISKNQPYLMHLYYTNRYALFVACAGNELFYLGLYFWIHGMAGAWWWSPWMLINTPIWAFKQLMNVIQLVDASQQLAALEK